MDITSGILLFVILALVGVIAYLINKSSSQGHDASQNVLEELSKMRDEVLRVNFEHRQEVQTQLHRVNEQLYKGISDQQRASSSSQQTIQQQFEQYAKMIQDVTQKLTVLENTNKQVLDFSSQLQSLQDILKNPKQRGILGEYYLETLLKNVLPPSGYSMQYRLGRDEASDKDLIPDAVVFVKEKIIPVDSKFSLENYNRLIEEKNEAERVKLEKSFVNDLKNRIIETSKYIQPNKGTMDFAFMFIPHEAIYYDLLINKIGSTSEDNDNLIQRAASKYRVIIVSPTSFLAYLQTVLQALRAFKIEETAQDIIQRVGELGKHFKTFAENHEKMGGYLNHAVSQYNKSAGELRKMSRDVVRITDGTKEDIIELQEVAKPILE